MNSMYAKMHEKVTIAPSLNKGEHNRVYCLKGKDGARTMRKVLSRINFYIWEGTPARQLLTQIPKELPDPGSFNGLTHSICHEDALYQLAGQVDSHHRIDLCISRTSHSPFENVALQVSAVNTAGGVQIDSITWRDESGSASPLYIRPAVESLLV